MIRGIQFKALRALCLISTCKMHERGTRFVISTSQSVIGVVDLKARKVQSAKFVIGVLDLKPRDHDLR